MSLLQILLLGFIQGITEFFPISSSGHLVLTQNLLGFNEPMLLVDVMLHVGTVISLLVFLRKDITALFRSFLLFYRKPDFKTKDSDMLLLYSILLASIPTFLIGYFFSDALESLFESPLAVLVALFGTAVFLFLTRFAKPKKIRLILHPILIGILQGAAIIPGLSRSGMTIGGALFMGWDRKKAARFSFLLSIPVILGASVFQLQKIELSAQPWGIILAGIAAAAVTGYFALVFLVRIINHGKFYVFAYYCAVVAILGLILIK